MSYYVVGPYIEEARSIRDGYRTISAKNLIPGDLFVCKRWGSRPTAPTPFEEALIVSVETSELEVEVKFFLGQAIHSKLIDKLMPTLVKRIDQ